MTELAAAPLPTPALLLDAARMRRNIARIDARIRHLGVRLRPHVKTHKCIEVAQAQVAAHHGAITVSTLAEARVFAASGFEDITYAVPMEPGKLAAVTDLVRAGTRLAVITDDLSMPPALAAAARDAGVTLGVWVKVDCGYRRAGLAPSDPTLRRLAMAIGESPALRFAGVLTHAGHAYHARGADALRAMAAAERDAAVRAATALRDGGIPVPAVSVGSTPTLTHAEDLTGVDEVRAGNYVFFDVTQATIGSATLEECAVSVLAAVVHRDRTLRKVILDAGAIALSKDRGAVDLDPDAGYGRVLALDGTDLGVRVGSLSQEHGVVPVEDDAVLDRLSVGTRVRVLANHACLTVAQHEAFHVVEDGRIVDRWTIHRGWA